MTSSDDKATVESRARMTPEDWKRLEEMTDEEIAAAVADDPDAAALSTPERPSRARRLALAKLVRQKLRMT